MKRRKFIQSALASTAAFTSTGVGSLFSACSKGPLEQGNDLVNNGGAPFAAYPHDPVRVENFTNPLFIPGGEGPFGVLKVTDTPLTLTARPATFPILDGRASPFLRYETSDAGKSYQNPILRIKSGSRFTSTLQNGLTEPTIIHWHGLHLPANMDGQPRFSIAPGENFPYAFAVPNRGGTYWYHSHADQLTAKQVYGGLASFLIVEDDDELNLAKALDLKLGQTDLPLLIQDKRFNNAGQLVYQPNPMERMMGYIGDIVLVNMTPNPYLELGPRFYRFRCLNGSTARIYKLAFMRGNEKMSYQVIGTDGGLLDRPYPATEVFLAPAERLDVLFDASQLRQGETVFLKSLAFDPLEQVGMGGMGGGMMGGRGNNQMSQMGGNTRLANGLEFNLLKLVAAKGAPGPREVPARLSTVATIDTAEASPRRVTLSMGHMQWLINGQSYRSDAAAFEVRRAVEVWDIENATNSMVHPMHLHGFSFQVLGRSNSPAALRPLATASDGRVVTDLGWKDTVMTWPGETLRIAVDFRQAYPGAQLFLFHCHNLEHEDGNMMVNYRIPA
jgi:FtsP/CotA-like multicopper oxidase with cupredoxin domain